MVVLRGEEAYNNLPLKTAQTMSYAASLATNWTHLLKTVGIRSCRGWHLDLDVAVEHACKCKEAQSEEEQLHRRVNDNRVTADYHVSTGCRMTTATCA